MQVKSSALAIPRIDVSLAADITYVAGATGSGKSSFVKARVSRSPFVAVWDLDGEFAEIPGYQVVRGAVDFLGALQARVPRVALVPPQGMRGSRVDLFEFWARAVLAKGGGYVAIAEELATVTSPGKAPESWGDLLRRARKFNISVIAVTNRPAESDKTALSNATLIHCGRLSLQRDQSYLSEMLAVPVDLVAALQGTQYIERETTTGRLFKGDARSPKRSPITLP